jgi:hypothetical protein
MRLGWGWIGAVCWLVSGCADVEPLVSVAYDPELTHRLAARDALWPAACERPASRRIGVPGRLQKEPTPRPESRELALDLARAVQGLPRPFGKLFEAHVCALVLIHDAPFTGTLTLLEGDRARGIIVLNADNLQLPPNEWLSFKESSAFEPAPERAIRGLMAEPRENVRSVLLEFLVVHELAHILDAALPKDGLIQSFKSLSWPRSDALARTPFLHYPQRISAQPLPDELLEPYYRLIAQGAFASPATVSNDKEDFADSLATFTHTVLRGRPWRLEVLRNGQRVLELETCWAEPRCREKRGLLEALLRRWRGDAWAGRAGPADVLR